MTTLLIAIVFLQVLVVAQLGFMTWAMANIRSDQLMIRHVIAVMVRKRRLELDAPEDDEGFYRWLQAHPDRPHRDDPPLK